MTEEQKRDFLIRMGYHGGIQAPKRVPSGIERYKKLTRKTTTSRYIDKVELMKLYNMFSATGGG